MLLPLFEEVGMMRKYLIGPLGSILLSLALDQAGRSG
jgi:hypothetical protein